MIRKSLVIMLGTLMFSSCYYDVEEELYGAVVCETPETVTFSQDIQPLVSLNCAVSGCHSTGGTAPGNFETYDGFITDVTNGNVQAVAVNANFMPPSGALSVCDKELLQGWITQGALNN